MKNTRWFGLLALGLLAAPAAHLLAAAVAPSAEHLLSAGPDPQEIPLPKISTARGSRPGVADLPVRRELPDVLTMNDGAKVTTVPEWQERRQEMLRTLEFYSVGRAPPPPGNVRGREVRSQLVAGGRIQDRLVHLTFGPGEKLSLDIGIFRNQHRNRRGSAPGSCLPWQPARRGGHRRKQPRPRPRLRLRHVQPQRLR